MVAPAQLPHHFRRWIKWSRSRGKKAKAKTTIKRSHSVENKTSYEWARWRSSWQLLSVGNNTNACRTVFLLHSTAVYLHLGTLVSSSARPSVWSFVRSSVCLTLWTLTDRSKHLWLNAIEYNDGNNSCSGNIADTATITGNRKWVKGKQPNSSGN